MKKDNMKIPEARKLKSGNWHIQLRLNGESIYVTENTKKKCEDKARAIKASYKAGMREIKAEKTTPTLSAAIDAYIEKRSETLSPSTITGYKRIQSGRFQEYMKTPIGQLTDWQAIYNNEAKKVSALTKKKPTPKTLKNAYYFIRSVYKDNGIILPPITLKTPEKKTRGWLNWEQVSALVDSVAGTHEELPVLFALHSLRRSELLALDWKNIDLKNRCFHVRGAVVKDVDGNFVYKSANKNLSSQRTIPIMIPELYEALSAIPEDERTGRVITINGNSILYEVNKACRAAGVPEVGTHGLRHSFASLAEHIGLTKKETMYLGGWSDDKTMAGIYTHIDEADIATAGNKMTEFFKNRHKNADENADKK